MNIKELISLLRTSTDVRSIDERSGEIVDLIPETKIMIGFDQQNWAHQFNLWEHCLHTVVGLPKDIEDDMVFLAALIHDIGKPYVQVAGEKYGKINMHYSGHQQRSMEIVRDEIIPELENKGELTDEVDQKRLIFYVEHHDDRMAQEEAAVRALVEAGASFEEIHNLMKLEVSDAKAHILIPIIEQRIEVCTRLAGDYGRDLFTQESISLLE